MPVSHAKSVAQDCQQQARQYADRQNAARTELGPTQISRLVTTLWNAGNLLDKMDKFDPSGPAPDGFTKRTEFTSDGRLVIVFEQSPVEKEGAD